MSQPVELDPIAVTVIAHLEIIDPNNLRASFIKMVGLHKADDEIVAAEVGVFEGVNAKYMCIFHDKLRLFLVDAWNNITIYTGGPIQTQQYSAMIRSVAQINLYAYEDKVYFMDENSVQSATKFTDEFFDYIYIDGDHLYEAVKTDLKTWWPKVKNGGVFGGHDVIMPDISRALDEFIKENKIPADKWGKEDGKEGRSDFWIFK